MSRIIHFKLLTALVFTIFLTLPLAGLELTEERQPLTSFQAEIDNGEITLNGTETNSLNITETNGFVTYRVNKSTEDINISVDVENTQNSSISVVLLEERNLPYPEGRIASFATVEDRSLEIKADKRINFVRVSLSKDLGTESPVVEKLDVRFPESKLDEGKDTGGLLHWFKNLI